MFFFFFLFGFSYENFIWDSFLSSDCHSGQTEMEKTCKGVKKKKIIFPEPLVLMPLILMTYSKISWFSWVIDSHDMQYF